METVQWEYCRVTLAEHEGVAPNVSIKCQVSYFASMDRIIEHQFTRMGSPVPFFPLPAVIQLLGKGCWELVTVQHATYQKPLDPRNAATGLWLSGFIGEAMAYFKRPMLPGRAINEPMLPSY